MNSWLKGHPLLLFIFFSLALHLVGLGAEPFWGRGRATVRRELIECDYYPLETKVKHLEPPPILAGVEEEAKIRESQPEEILKVAEKAEPTPPPLFVLEVEEAVVKPADDGDRFPLPPPSRREMLEAYVARLLMIIKRQIHYPALARKMCLEGSVIVSFTLNRAGQLKALGIPAGGESTFAPFNLETLRSVRRASRHFPHFPESVEEEELSFQLPVSFTLH